MSIGKRLFLIIFPAAFNPFTNGFSSETKLRQTKESVCYEFRANQRNPLTIANKQTVARRQQQQQNFVLHVVQVCGDLLV